jgi:hypothetical protein
MRRIALLLALFWYAAMPWKAWAQNPPTQTAKAARFRTQLVTVTAKFIYDDGTPVVGGVQITRNDVTPPTNVVGPIALDSTGFVQANVSLDPNALYAGALVVINPDGTHSTLPAQQIPLGPTVSVAAFPIINKTLFTITIAKATGIVSGLSAGPLPAPQPFSQIKLANCASAPPATTGPTNDTGGGLVIGYIHAGQTFDCIVPVAAQGTYTLALRAASGNGSGTAHFEYPPGTKIGNEIIVPNTGANWDTYITLPAGSLTLPTGSESVRLVVDSPGLNLNWIN